MYDILQLVKSAIMQAYTSSTNTFDSSVVDTLGFESLTILLYIATLIGGTGTLVIKHGDTNVIANMAVVPNDDLVGITNNFALVPTTYDNSIFTFGYRGNKRYVAFSVTEDTAWTVWVTHAVSLLSNSKKIAIP